MSNDQERCVVCEGLPSKPNPLVFCDGEGCDMPVHKNCHNLDKIPEGDWYCGRCEAKRNDQPVNTVCCPTQTGALKPTTHPGDFMHIVCAKWNFTINHNREPYDVDRAQFGLHECHVCKRKEGVCIECSEPACKKYFHVTCAINSGLIPVKRSNFDNFSFACTEHRSEDQVRTRPRASRGRLVKKEMLHSSEDEEEDEEEEEEDEDDGDDDVDEDAIMEEVSDDEVPKKKSSPRRNNLRSASRPGVKRRSTASHGSKTGPLKLFLSDQSDTDEEQQKPAKEQQRVPMKEEEEPSKQQRATVPTAAAATTSSAGGLSFRERIEAKRKKASLGQRQAAETSSLTAAATTTKPTSAPPTNAKAAPAPATAPNGSSKPSSSVQQQQQPAPPQQAPVHKQKLPNKTHLAPNPRPANTQNGSGLKRPSASAAPVPVIKDLDEITRDMLDGVEQRWGTSAASPFNTPQTPTTPQQPFAFNGPDRRPPQHTYAAAGPRRSMDGDFNEYQKAIMRNKLAEMIDEVFAHRGPPNMDMQSRLQAANQEVNRLREENLRFKRMVVDVFTGLNVQVPSGLNLSVERIEDYVSELRSMMARTGPIDQQHQEQIMDYVKRIV